jgi:ribonuclease HI
MSCTLVRIGDTTAIVCTRGARSRSCHCGLTATKLCDGRVPGATKGRTRRCDRPICDRHATRVGDNLDHCPECVATTEARLAVVLPKTPGALVAYTDGSGTTADLPCGAGVVVYDGLVAVVEASVHLGNGTNNHAELGAVRVALWLCGESWLRARPLVVRSDSMYAITTLRAPYDTDTRAPNGELINTIRRRLHARGRVTLEHVHGHRGEPGNERADRLAGEARLTPRRGLWTRPWPGAAAEKASSP